MVTCSDAIKEVITEKGGVLTTSEIIALIYEKYPNKPWMESTIRAHLLGCSVNHSSSKHYPSAPKFLFTVGRGTVRLYNPEEDGEWVIDERGARVKDAETEESLPTEEELIEASIGFEKDLEEYLIRDLSKLGEGLMVYNKNGVSGRQFDVEVGRIDILAEDKTGNLIVVELKAGAARYTTLAQILSYTACIKKDFPEKKTGVKGIIVADDFDERLKLAVTETPHIKLVRYKVSFEFDEVI